MGGGNMIFPGGEGVGMVFRQSCCYLIMSGLRYSIIVVCPVRSYHWLYILYAAGCFYKITSYVGQIFCVHVVCGSHLRRIIQ
jgi:hypothetical protein